MALEFEPIRMDQQSNYRRMLDTCPQKASDYSFINLWGWAEAYGLEWAWTPDLVWIRQQTPEPVYWAPVGNWNALDWEKTLRNHVRRDVRFARVPEKLLALWQQDGAIPLNAQPVRGDWDYLYSVAELIDLKGAKYHKKKNLLNQFTKTYHYRYLPLNIDSIHRIHQMQADWCTWRDCAAQKALDSENQAILNILDNWEPLDKVMGGGIMIEKTMVAYTIAERLSPETLLIHFEKGASGYKGIYQAINQMFLQAAGQTYTTVNREPDLGIEGMRKAKLSYHPIGFVKKFNVTFP